MKAVLELLKRYVFEIGCGAGAALGIALSLWLLGSMGNVTTEMEKAEQLKGQLESAGRGGNIVNNKTVDKAQERIDKIRAGYNEVMTYARKLNAHKPLTDDVFPNSGDANKGIAFQKAYQREVGSWLGIMQAGDVPSDVDVRAEQDLMDAEQPPDVSLGTDRSGDDTEKTKKNDKPVDPFQTAEVRAAIRRARSIRCYATMDSFSISEATKPNGPMYDAARPPTPVEMWHAQLEVWVQRDIVDAIAAVNEAAAQRLASKAATVTDERERAKLKPWVGNLPIKELVSIQTTTYYVTETGAASSGSGSDKNRPYPPGKADDVFTGDKSNESYELMQFTVRLIVDARDIPEVIAGLSRNGFDTPLRVSYEQVEPNVTMEGKIYGDEPVVAMDVDFETIFLSELYISMMPDKILEELNKQRPEPESTEGA